MCSISHGKNQKYRVFSGSGVAKTKKIVIFYQIIHSRLFHRLSLKFYLTDIIKNSNKIKQNPKFPSSNHLSYPISSNHTKINAFTHITAQKPNSNFTKNPLTNSKSSLFIGTFTDKHFSSKIQFILPALISPRHITHLIPQSLA